MEPCQHAVAADPDTAVSRGQRRASPSNTRTVSDGHARDGRIGKSIDTTRGNDPETAFAILGHVNDGIIREPSRPVEMIHDIVADAVKAARGSHPQRTIAVNIERQNIEGVAMKCGSVERLPPSVDDSLKPEGRPAEADPQSPVRRRRKCSDSGNPAVCG